MTKDSENNRKYKLTQKILKIAIAEGGYTNVDIAKKAGLKESSGSLVSRWRNGKALATERQMNYFIKEYGGHLKRRNTHLFYGPVLNDSKSYFYYKYYKIKGEEFFSHKIPTTLQIQLEGKSQYYKESIKAIKVVVLESDKGYVLIKFVRAGIFNYTCLEEKLTPQELKTSRRTWIHGDSENSNWFVEEVIECSDFDELVREFQEFMGALRTLNGFLNLSLITDEPLCSLCDIEPVRFSFFQKCMKQGLQSEHLPF